MNDDDLKTLIEVEKRKLKYAYQVEMGDWFDQACYKTHEKTTATVVPIDPPEGYGDW